MKLLASRLQNHFSDETWMHNYHSIHYGKKSQDLVTSSNTEHTNMVYGGQPFHELKKDARKKKG